MKNIIKLKGYLPILLSILLMSCGSSFYLDLIRPNVLGKISIEGDFCATKTVSTTAPIKIQVIVDTSGSMVYSDPKVNGLSKRQIGVQNIVDEYFDDSNISFSIIKFAATSLDLIDGFTRDENLIHCAIYGTPPDANPSFDCPNGSANIGDASGGTLTKAAIDLAKQVIIDDIGSVDDEELSSRTQYFTILFSDGVPTYSQTWEAMQTDVLAKVASLVSLETTYGLKDLKLYSAFLGDLDVFYWNDLADYFPPGDYGYSDTSDPDWRAMVFAKAQELMANIATAGGGTYTHFENAENIDFLDIVKEYVKLPYELQNILVYNLNQKIGKYMTTAGMLFGPLPDDDADGMANYEENEIGTDPLKRDTDGDGLGDLLEITAGTDPNESSYSCSAILDSDSDALKNCEETYLGTLRYDFDTDGDGIPDGIEVMNKMDPLDPDDIYDDMDGDGMNNGDEVKYHMNTDIADQEYLDIDGYKYEWEETSSTAEQKCYHVKVSNISIIQTRKAEGESEAVNRIALNFMQTQLSGSSKISSYAVIDVDPSKDVDGAVYDPVEIQFIDY